MISRFVAIIVLLFGMVAGLSAATTAYNFDDADGAVDFNDLGVVAGDWTFDVDGGDSAFQNGRAEAGVRTDGAEPTPYPVMKFDITIPESMMVNLTNLTFDHGFNEINHANDITPYWELSVSIGSAAPVTGSLGAGTVNSTGYFEQSETVTLSGLTNLNNTTVTFEFTFKTEEGRLNSLSRAHTMDNVMLTGTMVEGTLPTIYDFSAEPDTFGGTGTLVTLSWDVSTNATAISISPDIGNVLPVTVDGVGQTSIVVNTETTFTLTASNDEQTFSSEVTISELPPVIHTFSADTHLVETNGTEVTFIWNVSNAVAVSIAPDIGAVPAVGQTRIVVNAAGTYTLTASNSSETVSNDWNFRLPLNKPNILVVLVDDMGPEDTSVDFNYDSFGNIIDPVEPTSVGLPAFSIFPGNDHFRTPSMETLAANGMKFSRAYALQVCSPTRCSLMTGQNSARHGTIQWLGGSGTQYNIKMPANPGLIDANRTLAEILRDDGYRTIIAGKGHIGSSFTSSAGNYINPAPPETDFYGFQVNISAYTKGSHGNCYSSASPAFGLSSSGITADFVAEYQDMTYQQYDPLIYTNGHPLASAPVFITEALTREMNERIEDSVAEGHPFFAYFAHYAVHDPHQPDPRFTANYPGLSGDTLDFATMIEGMDQSLGDVLAKLEELGVAEDTLVIFFGDNGSDSKPRGPQQPPTLTMTNPLRGEKGMRYEGGIRIPLIISWAKRNETNRFQQALSIPASSREEDLVAVQDLFPTILAAAGVSIPDVDDAGFPLILDGHDLSPYLRGESGSFRPQKLITHAPCTSRSNFFTTFHEGTWKLIYNYSSSSPVTTNNVPLGTYELYNLATDPYEAVNLATNEPGRVMTMARGMVAELENLGAPYPVLIGVDADLAALGLSSAAGDDHPVILPELPSVDMDEDGLSDNEEDPNRNGLQDTGETDADNADSDGDSTRDGSEVALGLDPLDPGSYFYLQSEQQSNGSLSLTWASQPGTSFEIRGSTNLVDWTEIVVPDISAASFGASTSYELPFSTADHKFYRIGLK
jgi:arylsulfatase A-like enzyme